MNYIFTTCALVLFLNHSLSVSAQEISTSNMYVFAGGWELKKGDSLLITPKDGKCSSIYKSPKVRSESDQLYGLDSAKKYEIVGLVRYRWGNDDECKYALVKIDGDKYYMDVESAILLDEVVVPEAVRTKMASSLVTVRKRHTIYKQLNPMAHIYYEIVEKDTFIYMVFQNTDYEILTQVEVATFTKDELGRFAEGLSELTKSVYKAGEANVYISDDKYLGKLSLGYSDYIFHKTGPGSGSIRFNKNQIKRIRAAVESFFAK